MTQFRNLLALVLITACASSSTDGAPLPPPPPLTPPAPVASISVTAADSIVFIGDTLSLVLNALDSSGHPTIASNVTWSGGNGSVAVDASGKTTGLTPGTATIVAIANGIVASRNLRAAYGAVLSSQGGTVAFPGHASLLFGPSSLKDNSRLALVSTADPGTSIPNALGITILPGSFVQLAQTPRNAFSNFGNNTAITFSYDPLQLPAGVTPLNLVTVEWPLSSVTPVGLLPGWPIVDSIAHTLTVWGFQDPRSRYGIGFRAALPPLVITASPAAVTLARGETIDVPVAIVRNNSKSAATFTISNPQSGITQFVTPQSTSGNSTALTLSAATTATPGVYPITIYATPGGIQTTVVLTVTP